MRTTPSAVFLIHLVQDIAILRPLVFMATRDFGFDALLLVSTKFGARDPSGIWRDEIDQICSETGARLAFFRDDWEAHGFLNGHGLLFAASESNLPQHAITHDVFRHAPASFLRVTLQHGFECVGFRHSADHDHAHGQRASFAADIICGWTSAEQLGSLAPSQRSKLLVTGPTSVLQTYPRKAGARPRRPVLVCENLHSVRFRDQPDFQTQFVQALAGFSHQMMADNQKVTLRTHPGGQYALRNKLELPSNVTVENAPMYRLDLGQFSCGISAPSSVLVDMLLADIPTAVWSDAIGSIDRRSFDGLPTVSSATEWREFARAAEADPETLLQGQQRFLANTGMPLDARTIYSRFAELFQAARRMEVRPPGSIAQRERLLFIANGNIPTLQLSFDKPLAPLVARGEIASRLLTEQQLRAQPRLLGDPRQEAEWMDRYLDEYGPSAIIFCRYSGPAYGPVLEWARREQVPVIYHIDDDLLAVPRDIGERKFAVHNSAARLRAVKDLLNSADLVYASTEQLKHRLQGYFGDLPIVAAKIYCAAAVVRVPSRRPARRLGYMASADHAHNLQMVLPAIERLLDRQRDLEFGLFGSIPVPERLRRFGDRIVTTPPVPNYGTFLDEFARCEWDIGICPLTPIDFNLAKADTKWVEYTAVGAAVVASRGTVYDNSCADRCGILAETTEEWFAALDLLVNDVDERNAIVERAQAKLRREFSIDRLLKQVVDVITQGHAAAAARSCCSEKKEEVRVCQLP